MKNWLFAFALIVFSSLNLMAQQTGTLQVEVTDLNSDNGHALLALFNNAEGFPTEPKNAVRRIKLTIKDGKATATIKDLPYGQYAISILHDANDNQKMDTNFLGIPKEGVGTSNNVKPKMGPTDWSDAVFSFDKDNFKKSINIFYIL